MNKKTQEQFLSEIKKVNPSIIILGEYINTHTGIKTRCSICGHEWNPRPNDLLQGKGCPKCANRLKRDTKTFITEIEKINPYIQVLGEYKNNRTGIKVKCDICGYIWSPTPTSLLSGKGCRKCSISRIAKSRAKTHDQFLKDLSKMNPHIEVLGTYITNKTQLCVGAVYAEQPGPLLLTHFSPVKDVQLAGY